MVILHNPEHRTFILVRVNSVLLLLLRLTKKTGLGIGSFFTDDSNYVCGSHSLVSSLSSGPQNITKSTGTPTKFFTGKRWVKVSWFKFFAVIGLPST